ncbi:hypothetical protein SADUNF_Sadunf02G0139900 [Salix dunnii]|uniref:Uncharacterized protein n=1 Tax=Salix dunnii TaxID=1413687 RepID=A0A835TJE0_9ROSI|nr:hypothetical protein SADUNF_Sadunf02G0139900 [Salix dunnii]
MAYILGFLSHLIKGALGLAFFTFWERLERTKGQIKKNKRQRAESASSGTFVSGSHCRSLCPQILKPQQEFNLINDTSAISLSRTVPIQVYK